MESYASQFITKDPHRPESGKASVGDILARVVSNIPIQSAHISSLFSRANYVMPTWYSPLAVITVVLLLSGSVSCAFDSRRALLAWYFLAYLAVYLLWPFDEGPRFILPVSPVAFILMWRGMVVGAHFLRTRPVATLASISTFGALLSVATPIADRLPGLQARASMLFWPLITVVSIFLLFLSKHSGQARAARSLDSIVTSLTSWHILRGIVGILIMLGVFQQAAIARTNLTEDASLTRHDRSVDCALWLRTAGDGFVMAQQYAIIHRLTGRRVASFPITSNPQIILAVMKQENVRYLVVNHHVEYEYFLPTEEERWQKIESAYPSLLRLVHKGPGYSVFEIRY